MNNVDDSANGRETSTTIIIGDVDTQHNLTINHEDNFNLGRRRSMAVVTGNTKNKLHSLDVGDSIHGRRKSMYVLSGNAKDINEVPDRKWSVNVVAGDVKSAQHNLSVNDLNAIEARKKSVNFATGEVKITRHNNGKLRQCLVAAVVNLMSLSCGITWGWPSPVIPQLRSSHPPIGDAPMSEDQLGRISGLMAIGGLITIPFCGNLVERIGCKNFAFLTGLPHIVSWLLIIFGPNYLYVYAARLIGGMGTAMTLFIAPMYISDIASNEIRGSLGTMLVFAVNVGTLLAYVVGAYLAYRPFACFSLMFSLVFVAVFGFMPETPFYLVRKDRLSQAQKSLMFLRGNNEILVEKELTKLRAQAKEYNSSSSKLSFADLLNDRATRKGLIISFGLFGCQQLSGIFAMISYSETIFKLAGSSLSAETASIIIAAIQLVGSCASGMLMERAGRRLLALISCCGMAISHAFVSLFFYLQKSQCDVTSLSWLPLVALSVYVINFCLGIGPVPIVITSEIFRLNISSYASTVTYVFYWAISFAAIQVFSMAMQMLGAAGCFFMLSIFCALSFVFTYCLVPETKGRGRQDIINELEGFSYGEVTGTDKQVEGPDIDAAYED